MQLLSPAPLGGTDLGGVDICGARPVGSQVGEVGAIPGVGNGTEKEDGGGAATGRREGQGDDEVVRAGDELAKRATKEIGLPEEGQVTILR